MATASVVLAGCSLFAGSDAPTPSAKGVIASVRATASAARTAAAAGPSGTVSGPAATAGGPSVVPTLRPKPGASNLPCNAEGLVLHLAQASGAVHAYLAKPVLNAPTSIIALKSAGTRATGAKAASYAANQLTTGIAAATGCATTAALGSVIRQTAGYLVTLSKKLAGDGATEANVSAAEALIADVNAQAGRAGLTIVDRVVAPNLLR